MNRTFLIFAFLAILCTVTGAMSGCKSNRISLIDEGIVSVEPKPSRNVEILWIDVYKDSGGIKVYGVLRRLSHTSCTLKAHVDVTILTSDGKINREARTPDIYIPRHIPGEEINWKRFEVHFPEIPGDARVQAVVHGGVD